MRQASLLRHSGLLLPGRLPSLLIQGLSPRGRGNPGPQLGVRVEQRSIPAWAGEPPIDLTHVVEETVYPRVGGGTRYGLTNGDRIVGLSPRGRGNLEQAGHPYQNLRSIPAWAGEPRQQRRRQRGARSIPAWAGEPSRSRLSSALPRVYPRVGGGTAAKQCLRKVSRGLSPRGRGNRKLRFTDLRGNGSIPAWAGEPL